MGTKFPLKLEEWSRTAKPGSHTYVGSSIGAGCSSAAIVMSRGVFNEEWFKRAQRLISNDSGQAATTSSSSGAASSTSTDTTEPSSNTSTGSATGGHALVMDRNAARSDSSQDHSGTSETQNACCNTWW